MTILLLALYEQTHFSFSSLKFILKKIFNYKILKKFPGKWVRYVNERTKILHLILTMFLRDFSCKQLENLIFSTPLYNPCILRTTKKILAFVPTCMKSVKNGALLSHLLKFLIKREFHFLVCV